MESMFIIGFMKKDIIDKKFSISQLPVFAIQMQKMRKNQMPFCNPLRYLDFDRTAPLNLTRPNCISKGRFTTSLLNIILYKKVKDFGKFQKFQ